MTVTERIRAMLDERGVEWWPMHDVENGYYQDCDTEYAVDGKKYTAHEWGGTLSICHLTPEQAIEATLGRGECELIHTRDKPRSKAPTLTCSECGWWTDRINDEWRYCPRCGKRVKA